MMRPQDWDRFFKESMELPEQDFIKKYKNSDFTIPSLTKLSIVMRSNEEVFSPILFGWVWSTFKEMLLGVQEARNASYFLGYNIDGNFRKTFGVKKEETLERFYDVVKEEDNSKILFHFANWDVSYSIDKEKKLED